MKQLLMSLLFSAAASLAAVPPTAVWEIRATGSSANAGCFVPGGGGTDYSQQDTPQSSGTDLAVHPTTSTIVTSASHNFTAADVGNCIAIPAGGGWTGGTYYIVSTASNAATLDSSPAATGTAGGTWVEGGALQSPSNLTSRYAAGNKIYIKSGTYNASNTSFPIGLTVAGTAANPVLFEGYNSTRGDLGTPPVFTSATNSQALWTVNAASYTTFRNIRFTHTATTRGPAIQGITTSGSSLRIIQCVFDGVSIAYDSSSRSYTNLSIVGSVIVNTTSSSGAVINTDGSLALFQGNFCHNNTGPCYSTAASTATLIAIGNVIARNAGGGIRDASGARSQSFTLLNNTIANNTGDGFFSSATTSVTLTAQNNIFYGNSGAAINISADSNAPGRPALNAYNAYGGNTNANANWQAGVSEKTLTADPFTNASGINTDYSLNETAGGGALLKGNGYPGGWRGITAAGHIDIGAVQSAGSGGGGGSSSGQRAYTFLQ